MNNQQAHQEIQQAIQKKYAEVSQSAEGIFSYPTGEAGAEYLDYPLSDWPELPQELVESFCGVGNPFTLGPIRKGESVLDIGCGAGFDLYVACQKVGEKGHVFGIDLTQEMVKKARKNLWDAPCQVDIRAARSEAMPFEDASFDVVTSNGVLNLSPLKEQTFSEIYRILKPGGRLQFADIISKVEQPQHTVNNLEDWSN